MKENPIILDTQISKVVLYRDGAKIERNGNVALEVGTNEIKLPKISRFCDPNSIRVSGLGSGTLVDIKVNKKFQEQTGFQKLDELIKKRKDLEKEIFSNKEELGFITQRKNDLNQIFKNFVVEFPKWFSSGESEIKRLEDLNSLTISQNNELSSKIGELKLKIEDLEKKLSVINAEIDKINRLHDRKVDEYYEIIVTIESEKNEEFDLKVSYQVMNAFWEPIYDVNLSESQCEIKYMASIVNNTFEDWKDVGLEVSTAVFQSVELIEPEPWYIDVYYPPPPSPPPRRKYAMKKMLTSAAKPLKMEEKAVDESMEDDFVEEQLDYRPEIKEETASFSENATGIQIFSLPNKVNIPSDGNPHPILLTKFELDSRTEYYWSSMNPIGVIAQSIIKNGETVLLPSEKVKVFHEKDFVGETAIKTISPFEEFKLGTRLSYDLKVEKKLLKRKAEKAGIIKGKLGKDYTYSIIINNFKKDEKKITVIDRIPMSRSEQIKVAIKEISPEPKKDNLNILVWELTLKPEETIKINYSFSVEYGKDVTIVPPLP
ncbi:MAG: mucoidy inhibitor MuiA family protein [Candidatus Helarchaeota archaeon]